METMKLIVDDSFVNRRGKIMTLSLEMNGFPMTYNPKELIGKEIIVEEIKYVVKDVEPMKTEDPVGWSRRRPVGIIVEETSFLKKEEKREKIQVTIGNMIDQLCVTNMKIWALEDLKRKPDATDSEIADATRKTNVLNVQRNTLIQSIDEELGQQSFLQGDTKMYGK